MHLLLCAEDSEAELRLELAQSFPGARVRPGPAGLLEADFDLGPDRPLPYLAFARQWLPNTRLVRAESVRAWAGELFESIAGVIPDDRPWALHLEPHYAAPTTHRIGARAWHSRRMRRGESEVRKTVAPYPCHTGSESSHSSSGCPASLSPPFEEGVGQRKPYTPGALHSTAVRPGTLTKGEGYRLQNAAAGRHRCRLIREALSEIMQRKRRHLLRHLRHEPAPFTANDSLVQLFLTAPDAGFISVAAAPAPFEQRHLLSPFPKGEVPVASDQTAPSRAFAKLVEAELRLGRAIRTGESCVDLGASPGSWTYVAVGRRARVIAVDRSPLREDMMANRRVEFAPGDAFRFQPAHPVDWLLCDVLAAPERTADLLLQWLRHGWCRQFVVTLKLRDAPGSDVLARLKRELPPLTRELFLTRLCANKKEVCAFGASRNRLPI